MNELRLPKYINPNIRSGIKARMIDELRLRHPQCCRHPIQKLDVGFGIQVDKLLDESPGARGAPSDPFPVPFREVDSVVEGLKPQQSKSHKEPQCRQEVNSC